MEHENLDMAELTEERRKAIVETIKPITFEELTAIGERLYPFYDHPWREVFFSFINENPTASFYEAATHDNVHIIYCHEKDRGLWFLPGLGTGPLQAKGLAIMKQAVESSR